MPGFLLWGYIPGRRPRKYRRPLSCCYYHIHSLPAILIDRYKQGRWQYCLTWSEIVIDVPSSSEIKRLYVKHLHHYSPLYGIIFENGKNDGKLIISLLIDNEEDASYLKLVSGLDIKQAELNLWRPALRTVGEFIRWWSPKEV